MKYITLTQATRTVEARKQSYDVKPIGKNKIVGAALFLYGAAPLMSAWALPVGVMVYRSPLPISKIIRNKWEAVKEWWGFKF